MTKELMTNGTGQAPPNLGRNALAIAGAEGPRLVTSGRMGRTCVATRHRSYRARCDVMTTVSEARLLPALSVTGRSHLTQYPGHYAAFTRSRGFVASV